LVTSNSWFHIATYQISRQEVADIVSGDQDPEGIAKGRKSDQLEIKNNKTLSLILAQFRYNRNIL